VDSSIKFITFATALHKQNFNYMKIKSADTLGALASALCIIHCLATPIIFVAHAQIHHQIGSGHNVPLWWGVIDILFLIMSLVAIYHSSKLSDKLGVKSIFYVCWFTLAFIIVNEKLHFISLKEWWIYLPAITLIFLHLYNHRQYHN